MSKKEEAEWESWKKRNGRQPDEFAAKFAAAAGLFLVIVIGSGLLFLMAGAETVTFNVPQAFSFVGKCVVGVALLAAAAVALAVLIPDGRIR